MSTLRHLRARPAPALPRGRALSTASTLPVLNAAAAAAASASTTNILARVAHLTATTPWRLTPARTGLARTYAFRDARAALAFADAVRAAARANRHDPEWSGCGRRVHVRWTTHSPKGLGWGDVEAAGACEAVAEELGGAAEGAVGAAVRAERGMLWPEWRRMERPGTGGGAAERLDAVWAWVREKAAAEGEGGYWPVWSHVYGDACVSQTRWRVVEDAEGKVVGVEREPYKGPGDEEVRMLVLKKRSQQTDPGDGRGETVHELLGEVLWGGSAKA